MTHPPEPKTPAPAELARRATREASELFSQAFALHRQGNTAEAEKLYEQVLRLEPQHADALHLLGVICAQQEQHERAGTLMLRAIGLKPDQAHYHFNLAKVLLSSDRPDDALDRLDAALALRPNYVDALSQKAILHQRKQQFDLALATYDRIIALAPDSVDAPMRKGTLLWVLKRHEDALHQFSDVIALHPGKASARFNAHHVLMEMKRYGDALAILQTDALDASAQSEISFLRGNALQALGRIDEAVDAYQDALQLAPDHAEALNNLGAALIELDRLSDALTCFDRALALRPDYPDALNNRGNVCMKQHRFDAALKCYERALSFKPDFSSALNNRGNVLKKFGRYDDALASYDQARQVDPGYADAHYNHANLLREQKRFEEADRSYACALDAQPGYPFLQGIYLYNKLYMCDWRDFDDACASLADAIALGKSVAVPFAVQTLIDSPAIQQKCAETYTATTYPPHTSTPVNRAGHTRIRIGYFSSDFGDHPVSHLLAGVLESHDKTRFETYAFALAGRAEDEWRLRIRNAVDHFIDLGSFSDEDAARLAREMQIDIAIDLNGYTQDCRTGIFSKRAAPVQLSYIGFLGTMGAPYMDYLIADATIIPEDKESFYTEKIIRLPTFQCNDDKQRVSSRAFTRQEMDLPENGFVFCSFNNNYKITPDVFDTWMRILQRVPGSVLWIYVSSQIAISNLQHEAQSRGVSPDRLIFAKRLPLDEHLARLRLADLFLDTHPYNAGATASNALRVGLPVLTRLGESFPARMGASLLHAVDLPELITHSASEYEATAVRLATQPALLSEIRLKLRANLRTTPLFDTAQFTRHLEAAYQIIFDRQQTGLPPDHINLPSQITPPPSSEISALFAQGVALHQAGQLPEAQTIYERILTTHPQHANALHLLGVISAQRQDPERALALIRKAIAIDSGNPAFHANLGNVLQERALHQEAIACYDRAIALNAQYADAWGNRGNALRELGQLEEALASYDQAIAIRPGAEIHTNRGNTLRELRRINEALHEYDLALALNPMHAKAHFNRGSTLLETGQARAALENFDKAVAIQPGYVQAFCNRGNAHATLGDPVQALADYDRAIALQPDYAMAHLNRGNVLHRLRQPQDALTCYDRTIAIDPDYTSAYSNRAITLLDLNRFDEALASLNHALSITPDHTEALLNLGNTLLKMNRAGDALTSYDRALTLRPDSVELLNNRAHLLQELQRYEEAQSSYRRAMTLDSSHPYLAGAALHNRMFLSDWEYIDADVDALINDIATGKKASTPFLFLGLSDSPHLQQQCASIYITDKYPNAALPLSPYPRHNRIRVGYFSADFRSHPGMHLMTEMLEKHDRQRFELFAFSFGPDTGDAWQQRVKKAFDHFIDVRSLSDHDVARIAREMEIDIAINRNGFTQYSRTSIFALRAAPIQVNYLAYPGTMGADYMDYIVADRIVIPEESRQHFTEKVVWLPDCYQPNAREREIATDPVSRQDFGLPQNGIVFCSFNNHYKITPEAFDSWMRILLSVPGSVLWLMTSSPAAEANLRKEAAIRGIAPERLVFAQKIPVEQHLNRLKLADLMLDSFPYGAHTTCSDALRVGLPVVTRKGESFVSRVAASLLHTVGLPELITDTPQTFEALAVDLAMHPDKLAHIRRKLAEKSPSSPLFDSERYARNLEAAYLAMMERCWNGLPPAHITITP